MKSKYLKKTVGIVDLLRNGKKKKKLSEPTELGWNINYVSHGSGETDYF